MPLKIILIQQQTPLDWIMDKKKNLSAKSKSHEPTKHALTEGIAIDKLVKMMGKSYICCSLIDNHYIDAHEDFSNLPTDYQQLHHRTKIGEPCKNQTQIKCK